MLIGQNSISWLALLRGKARNAREKERELMNRCQQMNKVKQKKKKNTRERESDRCVG